MKHYYIAKRKYTSIRKLDIVPVPYPSSESIKLPEITWEDISIYEKIPFFAFLVSSELVIDRIPDTTINDITVFNWLCHYYMEELEFQLYNMPLDFLPLHNTLMEMAKK